MRFLPYSSRWFFVGLALTLLGPGLSVCARAQLGGNRSGTVTLKEDHELIRGGSYRRVRHPIYPGILLAMPGSAVAEGE